MNESPSGTGPQRASREEMRSALFAQLVVQQTNMALMLLGQVPHPETGETVRDLEAARLFIDQLEMLEVKTKGNLDAREEQLLKQSLMSLRMAFVQAVETGPDAAAETPPSAPAESAASQGSASTSPPSGSPAPSEEEQRKKFTKKY